MRAFFENRIIGQPEAVEAVKQGRPTVVWLPPPQIDIPEANARRESAMKPYAVLGTGMAGLGAGYVFEQTRVPFACYDKNPFLGGHTRSFRYDSGFVFDEGGHISFTKHNHVRDVLAQKAVDIAAIIVEPIQGEGGYIIPPKNFFPRLRELCNRHGILLILDEVQSGVGRTGKWWAIEHWGVEPDIFASAKGIASGVPLGLMVARHSLIKQWQQGAHGNTYGGNPIACAAALATLDLIENGYMDNAAKMGEYILDALHEMQVRHPSMGDVRGKGLMIGVEFVKDRSSKEPASELTERVVNLAFERGLLMLSCGASVTKSNWSRIVSKPTGTSSEIPIAPRKSTSPSADTSASSLRPARTR